MNARLAIIALLAVFLGACGREQGPVPETDTTTLSWYRSFGEARVAAEETGDIILVSFEAPWCPWSRLLRESVYVNPAVVESLGTVKCVAIDAASDTALQGELGVVVYPTMVFTGAYGEELGRMIGFHSSEEFLRRLGSVKRSKEELSQMFRREETLSEDPRFLMSFGRMLLEMGMYDGALLRFDRATRVEQDEGFEVMEEAEYSMAECYMLSGKYKEAGRRFRIFADRFVDSDRREHAQILAAVSYLKVDYITVAKGIYDDYLETFPDGDFAVFARMMLDSLNRGDDGGS